MATSIKSIRVTPEFWERLTAWAITNEVSPSSAIIAAAEIGMATNRKAPAIVRTKPVTAQSGPKPIGFDAATGDPIYRSQAPLQLPPKTSKRS